MIHTISDSDISIYYHIERPLMMIHHMLLLPSQFVLIENVANLVCKAMQSLMAWLVQESYSGMSCLLYFKTVVVLLQEFLTRGWKLQWVNVTGHEVGTHARACAYMAMICQYSSIFFDFCFQGQSREGVLAGEKE